MTKLEGRLEEAYNDLDAVDRLYDNLTQENKKEIDYCIRKRLLVCDRIKAIKKEIDLEQNYWSEFILSCVGIKKRNRLSPNNTVS